eukprot:415590-Amphidinium_carterae.1
MQIRWATRFSGNSVESTSIQEDHNRACWPLHFIASSWEVVYDSPGMQWMSVGSGIEHAEGGAAPKGAAICCSWALGLPTLHAVGETGHGFQIWINVPKESMCVAVVAFSWLACFSNWVGKTVRYTCGCRSINWMTLAMAQRSAWLDWTHELSMPSCLLIQVPESIPSLRFAGGLARLLAGEAQV